MKIKNYKQNLFSILAVITFIVLAFGSTDTDKNKDVVTSNSGNWWEGGTLHQATVGEWKAATQANKIATCSDWLTATAWKNQLNTPEDFEKLKDKSILLADAVDQTLLDDSELDEMTVTDIAAGLLTLSNDFNP